MEAQLSIPLPPENISQYNIWYEQISDGINGTRDTVNAMIEESLRGSFDFFIISIARKIIEYYKIDPRNNKAIADMMFWFVKQHIKFVRDPLFAELLQSPRKTLQLKQGDCDDQATCFSSLCMAVGVKIRFVTIAANIPNEFSHVYTEVQYGQQWIPYDTIISESVPGWSPQKYFVKAIWTIEGDMFLGLGGFLKKVKKKWKKVRKELSRAESRVRKEISRSARKIQAEKRRAFVRIEAEFARWERDHGILGGFMVLAVKALLYAVPFIGPTLFIAAQVFKNPFRLDKAEWILLSRIGLLIASVVISIVSFGTASGLLAMAVIMLMQTALSMIEIQDNIKARKELIKQLKAASVQFAEEERVQREAIAKLEFDITVLEEIDRKTGEYAVIAKQKKDENTALIMAKTIELEEHNKAIEASYAIQRETEYQNYCALSKTKAWDAPLQAAKKAAFVFQEVVALEKILVNEYKVFFTNVGIFGRLVERLA